MTLAELVQAYSFGPLRNYYPFLRRLVAGMEPEHVLELGTGTGMASAAMMEVLPQTSTLTTINWPNPPSGDEVGRELVRYKGDHRLRQILGDTRESAALIADRSIDLLFMDSGTTHNFDLISHEWRLYEPKLKSVALVCVDDLDFPGGGVRTFWDGLPYEKVETKLNVYGFGVMQYRR